MRGAKSLAASLAEHREAAALYRKLATLRTDVPIKEELEDLRWRGPSDDIEGFCREIGFARFLDRLD